MVLEVVVLLEEDRGVHIGVVPEGDDGLVRIADQEDGAALKADDPVDPPFQCLTVPELSCEAITHIT